VAYYEGLQITPPPLQGLTVGNPQKIAYLIPLRAQGDFLAQMPVTDPACNSDPLNHPDMQPT
jgi:hypothetical protein